MNITAEVLKSVLEKMIERNVELESVRVEFRQLFINEKVWIDLSNAQHGILYTGLMDGEPHYLNGNDELGKVVELLGGEIVWVIYLHKNNLSNV